MKKITGKQVLLGLAAIVAVFVLATLVAGYGWAAFLTPLTGVAAPGFWHLLGLMATLRLLLGRAGGGSPHQWIDMREHDLRMDKEPFYAAACFEWATGKLWKAIPGLLGLWAALWLMSPG